MPRKDPLLKATPGLGSPAPAGDRGPVTVSPGWGGGLEEPEQELGPPVERGVGDGQRHGPQSGRQPPDSHLHQRVATGGGQGDGGIAPRPGRLPALPAQDGVGALAGRGALEGTEGLDGDAATGRGGKRGTRRVNLGIGGGGGAGGPAPPELTFCGAAGKGARGGAVGKAPAPATPGARRANPAGCGRGAGGGWACRRGHPAPPPPGAGPPTDGTHRLRDPRLAQTLGVGRGGGSSSALTAAAK